MNEKYKLNKEWLDLMLENKNNTNLTFNLSDNDTRILLTYIEVLQQENKQLKEQVQDLKADYGTIAQIERDLYKEVIEEVKDRITIKLGRYINEKDYVIDDVALDELLQILDILKKEDN